MLNTSVVTSSLGASPFIFGDLCQRANMTKCACEEVEVEVEVEVSHSIDKVGIVAGATSSAIALGNFSFSPLGIQQFFQRSCLWLE